MNNHVRGVVPAHPSVLVPEASSPWADQNGDLILNPDFALVRNNYSVRLANEGHPLHTEADKLVSSMYGSRGLRTAGPSLSGVQSEQGPSGQVTLAAARGQHVVGTLTLGLDSGANLLADTLYRREVDELRTQGSRLGEVTRLAFNPESNSTEVMASLFNVAYILANDVHARTDLIAEVHPRHAGFYCRTMGYRIVGPERMCPRVRAPAVLLHLCLDYARNQIRQLAGTCTRRDRNLYRRFLPVTEQAVLLNKLVVPGSVSA